MTEERKYSYIVELYRRIWSLPQFDFDRGGGIYKTSLDSDGDNVEEYMSPGWAQYGYGADFPKNDIIEVEFSIATSDGVFRDNVIEPIPFKLTFDLDVDLKEYLNIVKEGELRKKL